MADLARAFSEVKSLPDNILQREISSPTGSIPGWLALGEIHERKRLRATTGTNAPTKRPSMAEEYAGNIQNIYAGAGLSQPASPQQAMPPQGVLPPQSPSGGIAGLPPPAPSGLGSMPQAQAPQGYHDGGIVGLAGGGVVALKQAEKVLGTREGQAALNDYLTTGGQNIDPASRAWCASFVNASLKKAGYKGTGSDLAKSFLSYGQGVDIADIQPGDIGVFNRGDPNSIYGHTGIVKSFDPNTGKVTLVAGNVGNAVSQQVFDANSALAFRRPVDEGGIAPYQRALLETIAGPESAGKYNVIYGGQTFDDYSKHPGIAVPIRSGPNVGKTSSAAGKYQFLGSTWNDLANRYHLSDFSPANQDIGALRLAEENYARVTGESLNDALQSGDPTRIANVGKVLSTTWTSLPGGIEQGIGTDKFVNAYQTALNNSAATNPTAVAAADTAASSNVVATQAADTASKMASAESAAGGDPMSQYFMMQQLFGQQQQQPAAAPAPAPAQPQARPVDARQFMQNPFFMQRRSAYG